MCGERRPSGRDLVYIGVQVALGGGQGAMAGDPTEDVYLDSGVARPTGAYGVLGVTLLVPRRQHSLVGSILCTCSLVAGTPRAHDAGIVEAVVYMWPFLLEGTDLLACPTARFPLFELDW